MVEQAGHPLPNPVLPMMILSDDGYVRLTRDDLLGAPLIHMMSQIDEDNPDCPKEGSRAPTISGYTEWISTTTPALTVGWDWVRRQEHSRPRYLRLNAPRSNIMLIDDERYDLGPDETNTLLESIIDAIPWEKQVDKSISIRQA